MTVGSFLLGLVYYAVAVLCAKAFQSKKKSEGGLFAALRSFVKAVIERRTQLPELARAAAPWFLLAVFMVLLGLVRQLNLQVMVTEAIQSEAVRQGWYEERSARQLRFVLIVGIAGSVSATALLVLLRKRLADVGLAVLGAMLLVALLSIRAASHHRVDELLMTPELGVAPAYWIEALGLAAIAGSALISITRRKGASKAGSAGPIVARIDSVDPPR